jgi:hypothetical protein
MYPRNIGIYLPDCIASHPDSQHYGAENNLKMEGAASGSVPTYQTTLRHIPEDSNVYCSLRGVVFIIFAVYSGSAWFEPRL